MMKQETITLQKIDGIYDIQPLVEPALSLLETVLLSLLLMSLISLILYFTLKALCSKKSIAKRKIKELRNKHAENKINNHDAIYQLCLITKQGLKLKKLNQDTLLPNKLISKKQQWQDFIKDTSILRYKNNTESHVDINKLFSDSLFWLKVWP